MSDDYVKNAMNLGTPNERRVTHHVFEQTYFTNDAIVGNSNYTFQFPETWAGLPTKRKAVGFRYAKRKVNSYFIMFEFELKAKYEDGTTQEYPKGEVKLNVTSENSVDEIVYEISRQMNVIIKEYNEISNDNSDNDRFQHVEILGICGQASKNDGSLYVKWITNGIYNPVGKNKTLGYILNYNLVTGFNDEYENFLKFFNQTSTIGFHSNNNYITLNNVWDRKTLYIHSDVVTNTNYLLMDREGTFYRKPSKIYQYNYNGNVFHIWLSFDGKTKAKLLYENVEIALAFFADVDDNYS